MGVKNLVGFAHIPTTNWIVVSQQPTDELLKRAKSIISRVSGGIFLLSPDLLSGMEGLYLYSLSSS